MFIKILKFIGFLFYLFLLIFSAVALWFWWPVVLIIITIGFCAIFFGD
jgi:hypothetical protein